jgi:GTP cyclohydrolase I
MNLTDLPQAAATPRPELAEVEAAVRTLLRWAGDDPTREGLLDTPNRVARAYREFFSGYEENPTAVLSATFEEAAGYDDMVLVGNIRFESHCEHHLVPIVGLAHIAYLPGKRVVGLSKLARVVDLYSKRLQIQERLTSQIADTIYDALQPRGLAVVIEAEHMCMTTRGAYKPGSSTMTQRLLGLYRTDAQARHEVLAAIRATARQGSHHA